MGIRNQLSWNTKQVNFSPDPIEYSTGISITGRHCCAILL